jgi:hypothetical protein
VLIPIVHVCSTAPDVLRVLHTSIEEYDSSTTAVMSITLEMAQRPRQSERLGTDMATNFTELDRAAYRGVSDLSGLDLLQHVNLICAGLRVRHIQTVAYAPTCDSHLINLIEEAGTQTIIDKIELVSTIEHRDSVSKITMELMGLISL